MWIAIRCEHPEIRRQSWDEVMVHARQLGVGQQCAPAGQAAAQASAPACNSSRWGLLIKYDARSEYIDFIH